jgi:hypothetical protein
MVSGAMSKIRVGVEEREVEFLVAGPPIGVKPKEGAIRGHQIRTK